MAKRYYNLEKETKALLKRWEETRGVLPDSAGIQRVNEYITKKKGLGELVGGIGKYASLFDLSKSQTLTCNSNASLQAGDIDFSLSGWVRFSTLSAYQSVVGKGAFWGTGEFTLFLSGGAGNPLCFGVRNAANSASSRGLNDLTAPVGSSSIGNWIFFVAWHDAVNNTLNLQLNNGNVSSQSWSQGVTTTGFAFTIGGHSAASNVMNGAVDNLFYTKELLNSDIKTFLYNSGRGSSYLEVLAYYPQLLNNMVGYWGLNEYIGVRRDMYNTNHLAANNNPLGTQGIVEELF